MNNLTELRDELRVIARDRDWDQFHTPKNLALALGGEVGELFEIIQWKKEEEILNLDEADKTKLSHEVADILVYLVRFADVMKIDLMPTVSEKLRLNKLKYPVEKAKGNAKKYDEF